MDKNRKTAVISLIALIALFLISITAVQIRKAAEPVEITFVHDLSESESALLAPLIDQFEKQNEKTKVKLTGLNSREIRQKIFEGDIEPDIFLWPGPVEQEFPFTYSEPERWIGTGWTLAVNRSLIPEEILASIKSAETMDILEKSLDLLKEQGITSLSVGNSHLWPLILWSQHIMISLNDGDTDYIPGADTDNIPYVNSWEILQRWKRKGFFLEETWNEGWPRGVAAMALGKAAMTLLSDEMLTPIPPEVRSDIEFIKFPQGNRKSWLIGAGVSLVVNLDSPAASEAAEFRDFLKDPATCEYLTYRLQRFFYSNDDDAFAQHVASWQELSNTREMREYGRELRRFVEE